MTHKDNPIITKLAETIVDKLGAGVGTYHEAVEFVKTQLRIARRT